MFSKKWKELQNKRRDNKGAALVMVIIAIAFIGMLVGMILYMAYCNYLMKANDTLAKDNFYSAEYALDVINAGLQMDVSEAMSEAYVTAMKNSAGKSSEVMELDFQDEFVKKMQTKLQVTEVDPSGNPVVNNAKWNLEYLKSFWTKANITTTNTSGSQGAYLGTKVADGNTMEVANGNAYITLNNLEIVYTDDRGFVSIITTDIRIKVPSVGFAQAASKMSIENFSLIANDALINDTNNTDPAPDGTSILKGSDVKISGNVFGGYDGVYVDGSRSISFERDAADATNTSASYNLIAEKLDINNGRDRAINGLSIDETFDTYVSNINITTARADIDGDIYVGDDMDVSGTGSVVKLSGIYRGYGNSLNDSEGSSSILINGGNTTLDFSDLKELSLSGHAYVGAKKYDADLDRLAYAMDVADKDNINSDEIPDAEEYNERLNAPESTFVADNTTVPKNETDFLMGESISVKANQLLYMVPTECISFSLETNEQVQTYAKNPMTYEEYTTLSKDYPVLNTDGTPVMENGLPKTEKKYDVVRLSHLWNKLGGAAYTNDYKAVFRRVNGTVLVYLYLDFGSSDVMANEFFKAYYEYDKEGIDNYVSSYISEMTWSSTVNQNLSLAGNGFYLNRHDEVVFVENHLQDPVKYGNMLVRQTEYANTFEALKHSLSTNYDELTSTQQSSEIFDSLVDEAAFAKLSGLNFNNGLTEADPAMISARIKDGSIVYPSTECPSSTKLIVASGDIFIKADFKGLAVAGGNIYVCSGCNNINYSPSEVMQAMRTTATASTGETVHAYDIFGASGNITYGNDGTVEEEAIDLSDLILYQNWKKE
ncbi:MAG: hypothetical protein E7289_08335 [Lachnospiraceae bacterium]|nr:hypothetical protein [Lachnospiraceae bacterium]